MAGHEANGIHHKSSSFYDLTALNDRDKKGLIDGGATVASIEMFGVQHSNADVAMINNEYKKANPIFG